MSPPKVTYGLSTRNIFACLLLCFHIALKRFAQQGGQHAHLGGYQEGWATYSLRSMPVEASFRPGQSGMRTSSTNESLTGQKGRTSL
eukprot:5328052-Amphidinium_carterae.4